MLAGWDGRSGRQDRKINGCREPAPRSGQPQPALGALDTQGIQGALGFLDLGQRASADDPRSACLFVSHDRYTLALTTDASGSAGGLEISVRQGVTI